MPCLENQKIDGGWKSFQQCLYEINFVLLISKKDDSGMLNV